MFSCEALLEFYSFMHERQSIWYRRFVANIPAPWTDDSTLHKYKFCNVYREFDRGTIVLLKRIINNPELSYKDKVFATIFYRMFNLPDLLLHTTPYSWSLEGFNFDDWVRYLDHRKGEGLPVFSDAYTLTQQPYDVTDKRQEKHYRFLRALGGFRRKILDEGFASYIYANSKDKVFNHLLQLKLVGPFLAYEIYCDLSYDPQTMFNDNDFVNVGPGAEEGIDLMLGRSLRSKSKYTSACWTIWEQQEFMFEELAKTGRDWRAVAYKDSFTPYPNLSIRSIEHSLCEFRKYTKLSKGIGRKRYYRHAG